LLDELKDLLDGNHTTSIGKRIKIVITSRPHIPMDSYFPDVVEISLDTNNLNDIADYVHASDVELRTRNFSTELRQEIHKTLIEESSGMFLWVYLILYDLTKPGRKSEHAIRTKLKSLPKTLPDLYKKILCAIEPDDVEFANDILRWVVWAERPLTLRELTTAIAIQSEHRSMSALTELVEPNLESELRSILGALIAVQNDIVYLVHQSAKEFPKETNSTQIEWLSLQSNESNLHITVSCMTYLSFDEFENPLVASEVRTKSEKGLVDDLFFDYASSYWPAHMKQLDDELQQEPLVKKTFLYFAQSSKKLTLAWNNYRHYVMNYPQGNTPLVITTNYGVPHLIQFLLDDGADINAWCNEMHGTALHQAATNGMEHIVRLLVDRGADINTHRGNDGSALQAAVRRSLGGIVRLLLELGADSNARDNVFGNVLQLAAYQGNYEIVYYLVEHGANVNAQDGFFGNALKAATDNGHKDIVSYLVEQGANVNARDGRYSNSLQDAAHKGKLDIVCHLVEHGANVNAQGGNFGNALQAAVCKGHNDICHYLVEQGADVNIQGGKYGNALQAARCQDNHDIVDYLLENGGI
jgi:ankyrin repeat protein